MHCLRSETDLSISNDQEYVYIQIYTVYISNRTEQAIQEQIHLSNDQKYVKISNDQEQDNIQGVN